MDSSYDPPENFRESLDLLHDVVARELGGAFFGAEDYLPGLKVLLQSMDYDPRFTARGRRMAWGMVVGTLKARAHAIKSMAETPGFDRQAILDPVVIVGVPRTGTTALHRLLATDPRFQGLQSWLLDAPMPRPPVESWREYPEFQKTVAVLEARNAAAPGHRAAHHVAAEDVHECCMLLRQSFVSNILSCGWSAATYDAWWQSASEEAAYLHYYRCVQLIGSTAPRKRWLLKNPGHIDKLDLLFAVFPGARVIQTHRDPAKSVPSLVSLLMKLHAVMEEGRFAQRARIMLARETMKWASAVRRCEAVRARHPGQVLDIVHADYHRAPMAQIERIYDFIGMELPEEIRARLRRRSEAKPELSLGAHRYDIREYGMTEEEVRALFGGYVERFGLVERG